MTDPIPSAGETTIIGLPAINVLPVTATGDRPSDSGGFGHFLHACSRTSALSPTRAVSGSRYLLDEDEITVGRDPRADILLDDSTYPGSTLCSAGSMASISVTMGPMAL